jgi:hypothetical protein
MNLCWLPEIGQKFCPKLIPKIDPRKLSKLMVQARKRFMSRRFVRMAIPAMSVIFVLGYFLFVVTFYIDMF